MTANIILEAQPALIMDNSRLVKKDHTMEVAATAEPAPRI
jgi:hypothetical protein